MDIITLKILRGPNYWSNYRKKLIALKLDLQEFEYLPSNQLPGFNERLQTLLPTLYSHRCSRGIEGGFFERLEEGTWLGHIIEHIALELQCLAGMDCGFGRTYSTHETGVYHVIFSYEIEAAGVYAAKAAVAIAQCLAEEKPYPRLALDIDELKQLFNNEKLGPSTDSIVQEAIKRNIPYKHFKDTSLVIFGQGCQQKKIWATISCQTSSIGVEIAANKDITKKLLASSYIPVPQGVIVQSIAELDAAIVQLGFPLVIKPHNGNHGRGITSNINRKEKALLGFDIAHSISSEIIVERFIPGNDYRFLVINYQVAAVAKRTPAGVIGDGLHCVAELIKIVNQDSKRGVDHENVLTTIKIDEITLAILAEKQLSLNTILPEGELLILKDTANLSSGGTARDVTDEVHPDNIILAERIARLASLDICGIDIVANDIRLPLNEKNGAVIEINAGPGFRMHLAPSEGPARNVAAPVMDMLYPAGSSPRIPLVAVTGTNGKTTVVRLMGAIAKKARHYVGMTTTEGIYIDEKLIYRGDCSGPLSASVVFRDPLVDFAVLECARGGILRSGLGFDQCDISIITNISNDHLGLNDIHTVEELAQVKAVVANSTTKEGYAILNADDELVYALKDQLDCNIALFSLQANARIREHCQAGGLATYLENDFIVVRRAEEKHYLANVVDIPLTLQGTALGMIKNILAVALASVISNFSYEDIASTLHDFSTSADNNPGRMNIFHFENFKVMIDYAHNEEAYIDLENYFRKIACRKKIGIIAATGDRRVEDIQNTGYYAAQTFDEIIIRHNKEDRGRTDQQLTDLILEGIANSNCNPKVTIISDEFAAIDYAMRNAPPGSFIYYSVDKVFEAIDYIKTAQKKIAISEESLI